MLIVAIVAAIMATATRPRVRGADNLFIPYTCFLVLDRTMRLGLRDLSGWVEGMLLGATILVFSFRSALTPAGNHGIRGREPRVGLGGLHWLLPSPRSTRCTSPPCPGTGRFEQTSMRSSPPPWGP